MLFNPSRMDARRFFIETWQKRLQGLALTALEQMTLSILLIHPEYHSVLTEDSLDRDWRPESGETNPFLHLAMHVSIAEQLSIDQPPGVVGLYEQLQHQLGDAHAAQHEMMDGLAEMLWQSQRHGTPPDPAVYFQVLQRKLGL